MAYIKFDYLNPQTHLKIEKDGEAISGLVSELPLVRGSWVDLSDNTPFPTASAN